jgi:membrane fusion protein, heavy metal efflux system
MSRVLLVVASVLLVACRGRGEAETPSEAQTVAGARTAVATRRAFAPVVTAIGTVAPRPGHFAELAAPAPTRVARVFVAPGDRVAQGDDLVEFERAPFDAAARSAELALESAERTHARAVRLVQAGILPQKDSDQAAADLAQAQVTAVTARRSQQLAVLRAPLGGVVTRMSAVLGGSVDASQPLVGVADPLSLDVVFNVSPGDAARVRVGDGVRLAAGDAAHGDTLGDGRVAGIGAAVDSISRAVTVRVRVEHPARPLRIGESVVGRIATTAHPNVIAIPVAALVPAGDGFQVFVVDTAGIARARPVSVGARVDSLAEILTGLAGGETVVTAGAYGIRDGARIARVPE